jgi:hypothetical protein
LRFGQLKDLIELNCAKRLGLSKHHRFESIKKLIQIKNLKVGCRKEFFFARELPHRREYAALSAFQLSVACLAQFMLFEI